MTRKAATQRPSPLPTTIGDHIRLHRSERKLLQRQLADEIGVAAATIGNWENNKSEPPIALMPAVIAFLGYDPMPEPTSLADRMRAYRVRTGLSIKEAALLAGVNEDTWAKWERTGLIGWKRNRLVMEAFLGAAGGMQGAPLPLP